MNPQRLDHLASNRMVRCSRSRCTIHRVFRGTGLLGQPSHGSHTSATSAYEQRYFRNPTPCVCFYHLALDPSLMASPRYVASRIFVHDPPGEDNAFQLSPDAPEEMKAMEQKLREAQPLTNVWACMIMLAVIVAIMAITAEFVSRSQVLDRLRR